MGTHRFEMIVRMLSSRTTRRGTVAALGRGLFMSTPWVVALSDARAKKHRRKKKQKNKQPPLPVNLFGCLNVGQSCRGDSANCCSGICQGGKPKRGKPDTSVCVAHNDGGCTPERNACTAADPKVTACGLSGTCTITTGQASFCASTSGVSAERNCVVCNKDSDCEALGFGPGSACALVVGAPNCEDAGGTCAGVNGSNGTGCFAPDPTS